MNLLRLRTLALLAAIVVALGTTGCNDEEGNNGVIIPGSDSGGDTGSEDTTDLDASDTEDDTGPTDASDTSDGSDTSDTGDTDDGDTQDGDTDGGDTGCVSTADCDAEELCLEEQCVPLNAASKCQSAEDLGVIGDGETVTASGDFEVETDALAASCSDGDDAPESVFSFTTDVDSVVSFDSDWAGQFDAKMEFRLNDCAEPTPQATECFDADSDIFIPAGVTAFLVVEQDAGIPGSFDIDLTATAETCPAGERICNDDSLRFCTGEGAFTEYQCGGTCTSGACDGDACQNAIEVTADATFSGQLGAYENSFNFDGNALCQASGTNLPTPGPDMVFEFPGLTAGQKIFIDTETNDSNNNAIFIATQCGDTVACAETRLVNENGEWDVPADGDYFVIVDKITNGGDQFAYSFEIR